MPQPFPAEGDEHQGALKSDFQRNNAKWEEEQPTNPALPSHVSGPKGLMSVSKVDKKSSQLSSFFFNPQNGQKSDVHMWHVSLILIICVFMHHTEIYRQT